MSITRSSISFSAQCPPIEYRNTFWHLFPGNGIMTVAWCVYLVLRSLQASLVQLPFGKTYSLHCLLFSGFFWPTDAKTRETLASHNSPDGWNASFTWTPALPRLLPLLSPLSQLLRERQRQQMRHRQSLAARTQLPAPQKALVTRPSSFFL